MKRKTFVYTLWAILSMFLFIVSTVFIYNFSIGKNFILPNKDILFIKRDNSWEVTKPYTYKIIRKNKIVIPRTTFFYHLPNENQPEFELVFSDDKKMVAVITNDGPQRICILYDMQTAESIPYQDLTEQLEDYLLRKENMLKKFNNNKYNYVLRE